jgi:uncharacterized membrane protein (Fun14 family)
MFHLIKFIVWLVGIAIVSLFVLRYFGYDINMKYFEQSKTSCQQRISECSKNLIEQGTKNATCDVLCVNPTLIIKKK